ncbi:MAG: TatD family hydrolase [Candidatus Aminicenantes bacterium]
MILVDSHAHLNMSEFDKDRDEVIQEAFRQNIATVLCPAEASDADNINITLKMLRKHDRIAAAAGVHPHKAEGYSDSSENRIRRLASRRKIKAVGEIGLDFFYSYSPEEKQVSVFRSQLELAESLKLPVIIHSREASSRVLEAIDSVKFTRGGVLHCFTESTGFAWKMLDRGFYISFSGILTFPKADGIRETAKFIPGDRILVETDSPYLAPVPYRGKVKRNKPVFIKKTAQFLAGLRKQDYSRIAEHTTNNFQACFGFEIPGL